MSPRLCVPLAIVWALALHARGQTEPPAGVPAGHSGTACMPCHTANRPTQESPSLAKCARVVPRGRHAAAEGPVTITMNENAARYGPVAFSHKAHAEMAQMGNGCSECHHEATEGQPVLRCGECHSASRLRVDLEKPDLKGALHAQCTACHQRWDPGAPCATCHAGRSGAKPPAGPARPSGIASPVRLLYATSSTNGPFVTFFHRDHSERFGLACAECHRRQNCASCHDRAKVAADTGSPPDRRITKAAAPGTAHGRCAGCHADEACAACHADGPKEPFDHGRNAGWALNRFHQSLACRSCHQAAGAFKGLDPSCESCHAGWQKTFDHGKTGLALDDTHREAPCKDCHGSKTFTEPPSCTSCHDDKFYPGDKPVKSVKPAKLVKPAATPAQRGPQ